MLSHISCCAMCCTKKIHVYVSSFNDINIFNLSVITLIRP